MKQRRLNPVGVRLTLREEATDWTELSYQWRSPAEAITSFRNVLFQFPLRIHSSVLLRSSPSFLNDAFEGDFALFEALADPSEPPFRYFRRLEPNVSHWDGDSLAAVGSAILHNLARFGSVAALGSPELTYLRELYERLISQMPPSPSPRFLHQSVQITEVSRRSPLEMVLWLVAPPGLIFAAVVLKHWLDQWVAHSTLDLKNKELATEANQLLLERIRQEGIPLTPELVRALMDNAKIQAHELPSVARIEITPS